MLHFSHTLFVRSDLGPLMSSIGGGKALLTVRRGMRVENLDIKIGPLITTPPQKPLAAMSSLAPSSVIIEALLKISPIIGCNGGSMQTSVQTSDSQPATVSLTSLWRIDGKPPLGQESERSTGTGKRGV